MLNKPKNVIKHIAFIFALAILTLPSTVQAKSFSFAMFMPMSNADIHNFIFSKDTQKNDNYLLSFKTEKEKLAEQNAIAEALKAKEDLEKAQRIDAYFEKRDMPLAGYGMEFVQAAEKYNIDWRLLPAIGVRESSGGKHLMNNNPFGWGSAKIPFADFAEAIEVVAMNLGGGNPNTARYYKDADTKKKLWYYNGTVMPKYPAEVIEIMEMI